MVSYHPKYVDVVVPTTDVFYVPATATTWLIVAYSGSEWH